MTDRSTCSCRAASNLAPTTTQITIAARNAPFKSLEPCNRSDFGRIPLDWQLQ